MTYTTHVNNYLTFVSEEDRERIRQVFKDVRANKVDKIKEEYRVHRPGDQTIRKTGWRLVLSWNNMMKKEIL